MAVTELKNPSTLRIKLSLGKIDGKEKRKTKSYSNLKYNADAQDVYDVATTLMALQDHATIQISKVDDTTIAE